MRIQCPQCAQRFTIDDSLVGKIVECGACDYRFKVSEEVKVNRPKPDLKASLRKESGHTDKPLAKTKVAGSLNPKTKAPQIEYREPTRPIQILGCMAAIFITVVIWLVFIYGSQTGGVLQDVTLDRRYVLAGSFAFVVLFLFFVSMRNRRLHGIMLGLLFGGSLMVAPTLFPVSLIPTVETDPEMLDRVRLEDSEFTVRIPLETERPLLDRVGETPLREAFDRYGRSKVIGVMVSGIDDTLVPQVRRYLQRRLRSEIEPMRFERDSGYFFVVAPTRFDLVEALRTVEEIGEVGEVDENMRIFALQVRPDLFVLPPQGELNSPSSPNFYRLNAQELRAFDHERVLNAAKRLAKVRPLQMRGDIRERLITKINKVNDARASFHVALAEALTVWANPRDPEALTAIEVASQLGHKEGLLLPRTILSFLLKRGSQVGEQLLRERWETEPSEWETLYLDLVVSEDEKEVEFFFELLAKGTLDQQRSAASLLGTIGGSRALAALRSALDTPTARNDVEFRVQVTRSIEALERKLNAADLSGNTTVPKNAPPLPDPDDE